MNKLSLPLLFLCLTCTSLFGQLQVDKVSTSLFQAYQEAAPSEHLPVLLLLTDRIDMQKMSTDMDRQKMGLPI